MMRRSTSHVQASEGPVHGSYPAAAAVGRASPAAIHAKRALDVVGASLLLVTSSPLLLALAVAAKLDGGPVFYLQERVGLDGRLFRLIKVRSMLVHADEIIRGDPTLYEEYLREYKTEDPAVVTRVGRVLRATYLDELPQLVNVIRGDMSLVGPRPVVPDELTEFGSLGRVILSVRPGMTGLWQVNRENALSYDERARMEARYAASWSLTSDALILVQTVLYAVRSAIRSIGKLRAGFEA